MSNNGSYAHDRSHSAGDADSFAGDPSSGSFFHSDYKKHDDLKQMLDSNKDGLKLEAMKRIIGMVARGRDASELFPAVVKNVVSKNIEVKKLVYVYLVRYAEEQQDLALLSISAFQRALKDPNQLIRASALRVLSSIRVPVIVPIVMLAIKDSAADMSPYVRKTAAHAIPKIYSLDPEQKEELLQIIEKLLSDKSTLVVGSVVMAFEEVCPDRIDLIHKNYRKLCSLLVDVDEWGQVIIINMLIRYARTQFADPDVGEPTDSPDRPFYDDDDEENSSKETPTKKTTFDTDYRLLLRSAKPLLQSRNASVVMAVASLYHHIAPRSEVHVIAKALIRLLRSHREVQSIVLNCIASISTQRKNMFEPFLRSFFVRTSDPTHIKVLKLEIMTNLATETNISIILREFQTYIVSQDKGFVAATIEAIGRCASNITEVTETCLAGLVALLSNRDPAVVAESVVVIKKLLQNQPEEHREIIVQLSKLVENVTVPQARASILWLLGEYSERVPKLAPDVLRKMAKAFTVQEDLVKLQIMTLAVKLHLTNPAQCSLLCQYVLNLAKYDQNYDIRDRARFMRALVFPPADAEGKILTKYAKKMFLATKPAPVLVSKFKDRDQFQLGSLSHYINMRSNGYHDLPSFPQCPPDSSVRDVQSTGAWEETEEQPLNKSKFKSFDGKGSSRAQRSFYSESEKSSDDDSTTTSTGSDSDSDTSSSEPSVSPSDTEQPFYNWEETTTTTQQTTAKEQPKATIKKSSDSSDESSSEDESSDFDGSESDSDVPQQKEKGGNKVVVKENKGTVVKQNVKQQALRSNLDLLLDLDEVPPSLGTPLMTPSLGGLLSPMNSEAPMSNNTIQLANPAYIPSENKELLNRLSGGGLQSTFRFTRSPHLYSPSMVSVEVSFTNQSDNDITEIKVGQKHLISGITIHDFAPISNLTMGSTLSTTLGIDFNDSTQPAKFDIVAGGRCHTVSIQASLGELLRPVGVNEGLFLQNQSKLRGMNETSGKIKLPSAYCDIPSVRKRVYEAANVLQVPSTQDDILRFAGQTVSSKCLVLTTIQLSNIDATITVNCEKVVVGSMLLNELKLTLTK